MKRRIIVSLLVLLILSVGVWAEGSKESVTTEKMTLRMGLITAEGHPVTQASKRFADLVNEKTGGNVTIQINPGGALGGEIEMHDMIGSGTLDLGCFGSGSQLL